MCAQKENKNLEDISVFLLALLSRAFWCARLPLGLLRLHLMEGDG